MIFLPFTHQQIPYKTGHYWVPFYVETGAKKVNGLKQSSQWASQELSSDVPSPKPEWGRSSSSSRFLLLTLRTQFKTYGFPLSSRYAPTPRFIFLLLVSRLKASVTPRMGSGGPISTWAHQELQHKHKRWVNIYSSDTYIRSWAIQYSASDRANLEISICASDLDYQCSDAQSQKPLPQPEAGITVQSWLMLHPSKPPEIKNQRVRNGYLMSFKHSCAFPWIANFKSS